MEKISIIIIEDNRLLREGLPATIGEQKDIKILAAFWDCTKALQFIRQSRPNIVLPDLGLLKQKQFAAR